jgi:carbon monoxide dehydrogenase subunit G
MKSSDISSPATRVTAQQEDVFAFLSDFNNFSGLMPDQVSNWKSTQDNCSFTIQGMGEFGLKITEKVPPSKIVIVPDTGKPIPFTFHLICEMSDAGGGHTEAVIRILADMPPMIAMMAGRPLQNLVNVLAQKLQEHFAAKS